MYRCTRLTEKHLIYFAEQRLAAVSPDASVPGPRSLQSCFLGNDYVYALVTFE